jgi:ribose 5-phosphate isomerase B
VKKFILEKNYLLNDFGTFSASSVDYPDYGHKVAEEVKSGHADRGILICGSGNGINIVANKHAGIRSALCWNEEVARLARQHNNANVIAIPSRFVDLKTALQMVKIFLEEEFEGGRHQKRLEKINIREC